jgi:hypothetical protein
VQRHRRGPVQRDQQVARGSGIGPGSHHEIGAYYQYRFLAP